MSIGKATDFAIAGSGKIPCEATGYTFFVVKIGSLCLLSFSL